MNGLIIFAPAGIEERLGRMERRQAAAIKWFAYLASLALLGIFFMLACILGSVARSEFMHELAARMITAIILSAIAWGFMVVTEIADWLVKKVTNINRARKKRRLSPPVIEPDDASTQPIDTRGLARSISSD